MTKATLVVNLDGMVPLPWKLLCKIKHIMFLSFRNGALAKSLIHKNNQLGSLKKQYVSEFSKFSNHFR